MIGKWNKSVILTYIGVAFSATALAILSPYSEIDIVYAFICLMMAGVCDMFDGTVARRCKRTKEEKEFGIQLDSLVDVFSFIAVPLAILTTINENLYYIPIFIIYAICGVARLAHFNTTAPENSPVKYYEGLPVTFAALIFPLIYLLAFVLKSNIFIPIYNVVTLIIAILFIVKIKVPKPKLITSIILLLLAVALTTFYILV